MVFGVVFRFLFLGMSFEILGFFFSIVLLGLGEVKGRRLVGNVLVLVRVRRFRGRALGVRVGGSEVGRG